MAQKNSVGRVSAIAVAAVFAATIIGIPLGAIGAPNPPDALDGYSYVALGDSYAAGYGLANPTGLPVPGCAQSGDNYPHQVAAALGLDLDDVSCSGAVTANIIDFEQVTPAGTAPLQHLALSDETQIVTVMIGGNDLGYGEVINTCLAASPNGPLLNVPGFANCESVPTVAGLPAKLQDVVVPNLEETFQLIATSAPNATVFVVGYPAIFPDAESIPASGCFTPLLDPETGNPIFDPETGAPVQNAFPFTDSDVEYLSGIQSDLNTAIHERAEAAGFNFISPLDSTGAHSACAGEDAYMNGISLGGEAFEPLPGAFHPNQAGADHMAALVGPTILDTVEVPAPAPSPTPSPTPSASPAPSASPIPSPSPSPTSEPAGATGTGNETLAATGLDASGWIGAAGLMVMAGGALLIRRRRALS